jgi:Family of unknown function (DUF6172)
VSKEAGAAFGGMMGLMRKTFQLKIEGKHPDRVLDATKHEIRQYIRRERNKTRPEGVDFWDFDCRFGLTAEATQVIHPAALTQHINDAVAQGAAAVYVELLAKPGVRTSRPAAEPGEAAAASEAAAP